MSRTSKLKSPEAIIPLPNIYNENLLIVKEVVVPSVHYNW